MRLTTRSSVRVPAAAMALCAGTTAGLAQFVDCNGDLFDDATQTLTWFPDGSAASFLSPGSWSIGPFPFAVPQDDSLCVFDPGSVNGTRAVLSGGVDIEGLEAWSGASTIELDNALLGVTGGLPGCRETAVGVLAGVPARFDIVGTGFLAASRVVAGRGDGADGTLVFDSGGAGPLEVDVGELIIGVGGDGTVELRNGFVAANGPVIVGDGPGRSGTLEAVGPQSTFAVASTMAPVVLGGQGSGELVARNGAQILSFQGSPAMVLGAGPGSSGSLVVNGPTSLIDLTLGSFEIGQLGHGSIDVLADAQLVTTSQGPVLLGAGEGSSAEVNIQRGVWVERSMLLLVGVEGDARVNVGELGLVEAPGMTVFRRGALRGRGSVRGVVEVLGGTLRPGVGPGTTRALNVLGDLFFESIVGGGSRGRLVTRLDGFAPGQLDSVFAQQAIGLAGTLSVFADAGLLPQVGQSATVLAADGGITGRFDGLDLPSFDNGTTLAVDYGPASVEVTVVPRAGDDPTFEAPVGFDSGAAVEIADAVSGDVTGDGLPDLLAVVPGATPNDEGRLVVLINLGVDPGTGAWLGYSMGTAFNTVENGPVALGIGMLNADEFPDAYFVSRGTAGNGVVRVRLNSPTSPGDFSMSAPQVFVVENDPVDLAVGDLNGDGVDDVAVAGRIPGGAGLADRLARMGAGRVTVVDTVTSDDDDIDLGIEPGSVDTYGSRLGLSTRDVGVTCLGEGAVIALQNDGAGAFPTMDMETVGLNPTSLASGDIDADGDADLLTADTDSGTVSILRSVEASDPLEFDPAVSIPTDDAPGSEPKSAVFSDLDGDGDLDIAFIARDDGGVPRVRRLIFEGVGPGDELVFLSAEDVDTPAPGEPEPIQLLTDDVDGDGAQDVIVIYADGAELSARAIPSPTRDGDAGRLGPVPLPDADVSVRLNAAAAPCPADLAVPFGILDLADVDAFILAFLSNDASADIAPPFGILDLADLDAFITSFLAGCP